MPMQRLIAGMPQQLATTTSNQPPTSQQHPASGTSNTQAAVSPERSKLSVQQGAGRGPSPQPGGPPPQAPSRLQRRMQTQEDRDFQNMQRRYDEE